MDGRKDVPVSRQQVLDGWGGGRHGMFLVRGCGRLELGPMFLLSQERKGLRWSEYGIYTSFESYISGCIRMQRAPNHVIDKASYDKCKPKDHPLDKI